MKFVETLGIHRGNSGVFRYKRDSRNITIDWSISNKNSGSESVIKISNDNWNKLLSVIESTDKNSFGLTSAGGIGQPANNLYDIIKDTINITDTSIRAYICAILEHEGSLDYYTGVIGQGVSAQIVLRSDIS